MAIVLALVITGWLIAFALGAQTGFDDTPVNAQQSTRVAPVVARNAVSKEQAPAA